MKTINYRNAEGYADPTPYEAVNNIRREAEDAAAQRAKKLIDELKRAIDDAGFDLLARIQIRDRETGKVFK